MFRLKEIGIYDQIKFETLNLEDTKNSDYLFAKYKPKYFAHLASQSSVSKSFKYKNLTKKENEVISENLINSLMEKSKDTKLFFPSTGTIFEGYKNKIVNEETNPIPLTLYSKTKYVTQKKVQNLIDSNSINANIGIMFSHESEFRRSNFFTKIITEFLVDYKLNRRRILNVGNIALKRDIGYAKEYTEAIFKILKHEKCEKYIVSSNSLNSLEDFIVLCLKLLEIKFDKVYKDNCLSFVNKKSGKIFISSEPTNYRKIDLDGIQGNNFKINEELDWSPKYKLEDICSKMITYDWNKRR